MKFFIKLFSFLFLSLTVSFAFAEDGKIEEVIVTATKKAENLQTVPIAITAVTGTQLDDRGVLDISEIAETTPNLQFEIGQPTSGLRGAPVIFMRGLGQDDFVIVGDPGVGVYVDGVYVGRTMGAVLENIDVERIEVLRGPQGTLFGKNTIGGAINMITKRPSDETERSLSLGIGEDGYNEVRYTASGLVGENSKARVSVLRRERDGYVKLKQYENFYGGSNEITSMRASLLIEPSDDLKVDLAFDYTDEEGSPSAASVQGAWGTIATDNLGGNPQLGAFARIWNAFKTGADRASCLSAAGQSSNPACMGPQWTPNNPYESDQLFADRAGNKLEPTNTMEVMGASMTITKDLSNGQFKSITAYREFDSVIFNDVDFTPHISFANNHPEFSQDQVSQEFQLTGTANDGNSEYLLGSYYFDESGLEYIMNQIALPFVTVDGFWYQDIWRNINNDAKAVYGSWKHRLSEKLTVTLGGRHTTSTKSFNLVTERATGIQVQNGEMEEKEFTPNLNFGYEISDDTYSYFTYSEGYRDGGYPARFVGQVPDPLPFYDAEFVKSYEVGLKTYLNDRKTRLNLAYFLTDYSDMQVTANPPATIGSETTKDNLGDSEISGLELELQALLSENLSLDLSAAWLNDKVKSVPGGVLMSGPFPIDQDSDLIYTPDFSFSIALNHSVDLGSGTLDSRVQYSAKDDYYHSITNIPESLETDHKVVNMSMRYQPNNADWEVSLVGKNITDEDYYTVQRQFNNYPFMFGTPKRPRHFTLRYKYNF